MTREELSQLYYLNREIEMDQQRIEKLRAKAEAASSTPSLPSGVKIEKKNERFGMPHNYTTESKIERYVSDIADLEETIAAKQHQCIHEHARLERYIQGIEDSIIRQIFTLRFINCLSWLQVAMHIGGKNTEDSVSKACYRYLKSTN